MPHRPAVRTPHPQSPAHPMCRLITWSASCRSVASVPREHGGRCRLITWSASSPTKTRAARRARRCRCRLITWSASLPTRLETSRRWKRVSADHSGQACRLAVCFLIAVPLVSADHLVGKLADRRLANCFAASRCEAPCEHDATGSHVRHKTPTKPLRNPWRQRQLRHREHGRAPPTPPSRSPAKLSKINCVDLKSNDQPRVPSHIEGEDTYTEFRLPVASMLSLPELPLEKAIPPQPSCSVGRHSAFLAKESHDAILDDVPIRSPFMPRLVSGNAHNPCRIRVARRLTTSLGLPPLRNGERVCVLACWRRNLPGADQHRRGCLPSLVGLGLSRVGFARHVPPSSWKIRVDEGTQTDVCRSVQVGLDAAGQRRPLDRPKRTIHRH